MRSKKKEEIKYKEGSVPPYPPTWGDKGGSGGKYVFFVKNMTLWNYSDLEQELKFNEILGLIKTSGS